MASVPAGVKVTVVAIGAAVGQGAALVCAGLLLPPLPPPPQATKAAEMPMMTIAVCSEVNDMRSC